MITDEQRAGKMPLWHPWAGTTFGQLLQVNLDHLREHTAHLEAVADESEPFPGQGVTTERFRSFSYAMCREGSRDELDEVRERLDELASLRLGGLWCAGDAEEYERLLAREAELLSGRENVIPLFPDADADAVAD